MEKINIPTSLEAELRVLGGALKSADWAAKLTETLEEYHFFDPKNRQVFAIIKKLMSQDRPVDTDSAFAIYEADKGSIDHFISIISMGSLGFYIEDFIAEIKESFSKRKLQDFAQELYKSVGMSPKPFLEILRSAEESIFGISDEKAATTMHSLQEVLNSPEDMMVTLQKKQELRLKGESVFDGIPTHFYDLDKSISGLVRGHFTIIGARPGVGKTTFALNLIENLIFKSRAKILFFSLEMPAKEISEKLVCQYADFSYRKYREAEVKDGYQKLYNAKKEWEKRPNLFIDDQPSLGIDQLKARALRTKRSHGLDVIVIDYIQLVTSKKGAEARHLEIGDISRRCKEIAKELNVVVVALAQLNREIEKRTDKTPYISDLRESGSLEADADEILLLHRPEMGNEKTEISIMDIFLAKNRFGPMGKISLNFNKELGTLRNHTKDDFRYRDD